jgi:hypothetical protein
LHRGIDGVLQRLLDDGGQIEASALLEGGDRDVEQPLKLPL